MLKKLVSVMIVSAMAVSLLAACGGSSTPPASSSSTASSSAASTAPATESSEPAGIDISKEVSLTLYLLGDEPTDLAKVYEPLNAMLKERINATLKTNYLSWGDWRDRYSLILAAGEDVDLMYTADWAFYAEESAKGAFLELTPEFMQTYMPKTLQYQHPASLVQATLNGKLFAIPKNRSGLEGESWVMVRKDLKDKYGMGEINSPELLEEYYKAVLANESGIFPHHASADGGFLRTMYDQPNGYFFIANTDISFAYPGNDNAPPSSAYEYHFFRDDIIPYFEKMKEWGDLGFWSANAISNQVQVRDSFENGTSASLTWNFTLFRAGENLRKNNAEWDFEVIDINPGTPRRSSYYTNDAIAIAAASRNPERAAMFIDLLKDEEDLEPYYALVGGIYGTHYLLDPDGQLNGGLQMEGPEFDKYPWNPSTWCFNLPGDVGPQYRMIPEEIEWDQAQSQLMKSPDSMGFRFDQEPVRAEVAALNALRDEYRNMLNLGMAPDVQATWNEWKSKAEASGLEKVMSEFRSQYDAWMATR